MNTSPRNAIAVTATSILIGIAYFIYISNVSFPHDMARIVPFVWLIGAVAGLIMGISTLRRVALAPRTLFYILAILNIAFSCIFSLGALMGD